MKKIILAFIVLVVIVGIIFFYSFKNQEKDKAVYQELNEQESSDLFGNYYSKATKVLKGMSLEEKVGQLFLVRYDKNSVSSEVENYHPGGYVLFARDFQDQTKESMKNELAELQKISKFPLVFGVDEEGGIVTRISRFPNFRKEKFRSPQDLYAEGGYELLKQTEQEKAQLLLELGIHLNLAPVADVSTNSEDFMYSRTFGKDAKETSSYIREMVDFANEFGISSCLKHFPGYGNNQDTHTGIAKDSRSYQNFLENDFLPFSSGIEASVPMIMISHNIIVNMDSAYPASLSKKVVSELRTTLGFSGIIVTDDLAMEAVSHYVKDKTAAVLAIQAGNDIIITSDFASMYGEVLDALEQKQLTEETVDMAVKRILAWKMAYGIY